MRKCFITVIIFAVAFLTDCVSNEESGVSISEYDSYEYCFNGYAIIGENGKYGIADTSGTVFLPVRYDDIEFVTDKFVIVGEGLTWSLVTVSGQVLAESGDKEHLISGYDRLIREAEADNILLWDSVIDEYETLCELAITGDSDDMKQMMDVLDKIKELSEQSKGKMTLQQIKQFEDITDRYNRMKGK